MHTPARSPTASAQAPCRSSEPQSLGRFIDVNRANYEAYAATTCIGTIPGICLHRYDTAAARVNNQYIVLEVDEAVTLLTRDELVSLLTCENASARRYFHPGVHQMQPYKAFFPHASLLLPETAKLTARVICLPTGTSISEAQIRQLDELIRFCLANAAEIKLLIAALPYPAPIAPGELPPP